MPTIGRNVVRPVTDAVTIQWANGKNEARRSPGGRFASHVGFFAEAGRDEAFDAFATSHGLGRIEMRPPRPGAAAQIDVSEAMRRREGVEGLVTPRLGEKADVGREPSARRPPGFVFAVRPLDGDGVRHLANGIPADCCHFPLFSSLCDAAVRRRRS